MRRLLVVALLFLLAVPAHAGRNCDGTDDVISLGSDASIDNIFSASPNTGTFAFWVQRNATGAAVLFNKDIAGTDGWGSNFRGAGGAHTISMFPTWTTGATWETSSTFDVTGTPPIHVVLTYDGSSDANNATFYVNGGSAESVELTAPTGTLNGDSGANLLLCEDFSGTTDANHIVEWVTVGKTIWTAAQRNHHRWWGRPGGAMLIVHPFVTTKTANEGTGTADATPTGTTVTNLPRVLRPGQMLLGMGGL